MKGGNERGIRGTGVTGAFSFVAQKRNRKGNDYVAGFGDVTWLGWGKGNVLSDASVRRRCEPERFAFRKLRDSFFILVCPSRSALGKLRVRPAGYTLYADLVTS